MNDNISSGDYTNDEFHWSSTTRAVATLIISASLFVLIVGPLANPVGSRDLTLPIGRQLSPVYQATFLGHGYRFFAPDPGPSHIVTYKVTREDGSVVEGQFPDRDSISPRLLYHRWFMLSETIFSEYAGLYAIPFDEVDRDLEASVEALKLAGRFSIADSVSEERARNRRQFEDSKKRFEELVGSVANWLKNEHGGVDVELFLLERAIASPLDVLTGLELDDSVFLTDPERIWPIPPIPVYPENPESVPLEGPPLFEEPENFQPPLSTDPPQTAGPSVDPLGTDPFAPSSVDEDEEGGGR